jgi:hypothetical protein
LGGPLLVSCPDSLAEERKTQLEPGADPAGGVGDEEVTALAVGELAA